jgi:hypothetical protein
MIVSIQASADHPSLVPPHWQKALAGTVTPVTMSLLWSSVVVAMRATVFKREDGHSCGRCDPLRR